MGRGSRPPAPVLLPLPPREAQRNRVHLDITPFDDRRATREELAAERDRLIALGATEEKTLLGNWGPYEEFVIMMRDPEGNEFCLQ
ncbi:VOC family protein [Leifsonia naganoensis]|uniref:VOC family protein n=1 Tax=Leifsonia naganoensis TaxID=150025 RepID=UPI001FE590E2|nr:VOC family protein [Leifsonia naganoensis]